MKKRSFTLVEIIIVVVVIGILATIIIPGYQNLVENSKAKICESNLKALEIGLEIYMLEHDALPADLTQLPGEYLRKGYASVLQGKDAWRLKLAHFILGLEQQGIAYATGFLKDSIAKGEIRLTTCPKALPGANSYGLNSNFLKANLPFKVSKDSEADSYEKIDVKEILIADCDNSSFSSMNDLAFRHTHYKPLGIKETYAQAIGKDKKVEEKIKREYSAPTSHSQDITRPEEIENED